jgi:hypothetical protein
MDDIETQQRDENPTNSNQTGEVPDNETDDDIDHNNEYDINYNDAGLKNDLNNGDTIEETEEQITKSTISGRV